MGFEPQIRSILKHIQHPHQTLLFSATWPKEIQRLAFEYLKDPIQINVGEVDALVANKDITQSIIVCEESEKFDKLKQILTDLVESAEKESTAGNQYDHRLGGQMDIGGKAHAKVIVFVAKKMNCSELANILWDEGFAVDCLHGDRPQWERTKVMNAFKSGTLKMLIATDVAARGLDVKDVGVVVNYDMPAGTNAVEDYIHRIGRTGRAGAKGQAYTFFTQGDRKAAAQLVEVLTKAEQEIPPALDAMVPRFHRGSGFGRGGGRGGGRGRGGRGKGYMSNSYGGGGRGYGGRGYDRGGGGYHSRGGGRGGGRGRRF
jgi:ATP-dependent RNA helicase DDX5/DBP2